MAKRIEWDLIEPHYRAGIRSLKDIGKEFEVSDAAIVKHAKKVGWVRDTTARSRLKGRAQAGVALDTIADEFARSGFIYVMFVDSGVQRFFKVGMACNLDARIKTHQCSSPFEVRVAIAYFVEDMRAEELALHSLFSEKRVRGEWFSLSDDDLRMISGRALLV